jgi:hypothetical protein
MARRITGGLVGSSTLLGTIQISPEAAMATAADQDITFSPGGTGQVVSTANFQLNAQTDLRFGDADSSNWVAFQAPATISSNVTWTLPATDGTDNQVLTTNASGILTWTSKDVAIVDQTVDATTHYVTLTTSTSGVATTLNVSSTKLTFQPSTGTLTTASISSTGDISANETISSKTYSFGTEFDNENSGTTKTIDWNDGQKQVVTMTGNCTFTFTAPPGVGNFLLRLVQDATGNRTANWPASVHWSDNTKPTLSTAGNSVDIVAFYYNGSIYYGQASTNFRQV